MLQTFLQVGGRKGGIDFDELGVQDVVELLRGNETDLPAILRDFNNKTRGEDPVLHFYEHFLSAYNKQLKIQRGVFYTPQPVVSYIVRSVHELLQTEFGLEHGLADTTKWGEMIQKGNAGVPPASSSQSGQDARAPLKLPPLTDEPGCAETISSDEMFVQILDPATGTATFLVEVIDVIHNHLQSLWKKRGAAAMPSIPNSKSNIQNWSDFWNTYVPKALLPRLHAYELMMAPYAIAHMKIGLKLAETGYRFETEERARIYLTNALEPWVKQLPLIGFGALAHEAAQVNEIKRNKRFTVIIGNPPYSGVSSNMTDYAQRIVDAYKIVDGSAMNERKLWLQDDYVKFIRKAQTAIDCTTVGVFGFITNNGYLGNPTFRGMRQSLMATFPRLQVLDLHGNSNKKEQSPDGSEDQNVFDIRQGVSICLAARGGLKGTFGHANSWGFREAKYAWLRKHWVSDTMFSTLHPDSPFYFFEPQNIDCRAEYDKGWKITEAMPIQTTGVITSRDAFATDTNEKLLRKRIAAFVSPALSDKEVKERFSLSENYQWRVHDARIVAMNVGLDKIPILRCCYRPFDERFIAYHQAVVWRPRASVTTHLELPGNLSLITARSNKASASDHFYCSRVMSEAKCGEYSTQSCFFPLYLKADQDTLLKSETHPNFARAFLKSFSATLNLPQKGPHGLPAGLTPEDIFHYAYAVFHSPGYRSRYAEFLKIDFPRLPLTGSLDLFRALAKLGGELTALHLLESPKLDKPMTKFLGSSREVVKVGWVDDTVWINAGGKKAATTPGTSGFQGVPEAVWNFHIGGYQVCEKWLKDRKGRTLTDEDIAHYHKIVISLSETIRLMAEIDQVIESHGGWPGAFAGDAK